MSTVRECNAEIRIIKSLSYWPEVCNHCTPTQKLLHVLILDTAS